MSRPFRTAARCTCLAIVAQAAIVPATAQIYVSAPAADGATLALSNHASERTPVLLLETTPAQGVPPSSEAPVPAPPARGAALAGAAPRAPGPALAQLITRLAGEYAVAEALIKAVIAVESGFDSRARSHKGAMGLMQLMPATARRFGAADAYSEEQNLRAGTAYLRWLLDLFAGDVALALAAYNAGEAAVQRAGGRIPPFAETRAYVPKVLAYQARYAAAGANAASRD